MFLAFSWMDLLGSAEMKWIVYDKITPRQVGGYFMYTGVRMKCVGKLTDARCTMHEQGKMVLPYSILICILLTAI